MAKVKIEWCKENIIYLEKQAPAVNLEYRNKIFEALQEKAEREKMCCENCKSFVPLVEYDNHRGNCERFEYEEEHKLIDFGCKHFCSYFEEKLGE